MAVLQNAFYSEVIRHRNFNPRLVEWLSGYARLKGVPAIDYQQHVRALLNNPREIWRHAFDNQISEAARNVLLTMAVLGWGAEADALEISWEALHRLKSRKYNFPTTANDFKRALNDLESAFLKISEQRVSFLNPSIRGFVQTLFHKNSAYAKDVIEAAVRFSQIRSLRDLQKTEDESALTEVLAPTPNVIEALKRVIDGPYLRWHHEADGRLVGTYIDDAPDSRLRTIIKWADETRSHDMLALVTLAYEHLQKELSFFIPVSSTFCVHSITLLGFMRTEAPSFIAL